MTSIRVFLVSIILALVMLFSFLAALRGYQSSMLEADRMFDKQLLDTAKLIGSIRKKQAVERIQLDNNFTFQIWRGNKLLAASANAPAKPMQLREHGFSYSNFNGYRWRTVAHYKPGLDLWVLAAERTDLRFVLAENVILESILPIVISLPILALLIWIIVTKGLSPLRVLAKELADKQPDDLDSLQFKTPRKELEQIVNSLNGLLARLETSLLRERQFASDAAHELRTPISTLKVQLYNVAEQLPDDSEEIKHIEYTVDRLAHIVDQILDLHRISPDQYNAKLKSVNLKALAQQVLADCNEQFELKQQQLSFTGSDMVVRGDEFALKTLLQNLLTNAHKYTPVGGAIQVSLEQVSDGIELCVEDSGEGIDESLQQRIFERFYRVGGDRHQSGEPGCGLGLAIVKNIAQVHEATVAVRTSALGGAAFYIHFPINSDLA